MVGYIAAWAFFVVVVFGILVNIFTKKDPAWVQGLEIISGAAMALVIYLWIAGVRP